ncbi:MAG TPA: iron transporter [Chloroflexia bacterium]|nr:iron transporter [Chloroflexia bacterium]
MTQEKRSPVQERPSDEAKGKHLPLAKEQGQALQHAVEAMNKMDSHGKPKQSGDYLISYAVEEAEGLYMPVNGELQWVLPPEANAHIEVLVRDAGDGRFIPGLTVNATIIDSHGKVIDRSQLPFLWHPWLYHYGLDVTVPGSGDYTLRIQIDPPSFPRHDKVNGKRYTQPVEVEFTGVKIESGRKKV